MHLVRLLSSSILFVRLVAIAVREFSVPYISEDIFTYASHHSHVSMYLIICIFSNLFLIGFFVFGF